MSATVKITGESRGAVDAVNRLSGAFRSAGSSAGGMVRETFKMSAAIVGAGSVVEGMRKAIELARRSITDYAATNEEAANGLAALSDRASVFRQRIGEIVLGGDNARVTVGALIGVMDSLGVALGDVEGQQAGFRNGLAAAIGGMASAMRAAAFLRESFTVLQQGIAIASVALESVASVSTAIGITVLRHLVRPFTLVSAAIRGLLETASSLSSFLPGEMGRSIESATARLAGFAGGLADTDAAAAEMARTMARGGVAAAEGLGQQLTDIGEAGANASRTLLTMGDSLDVVAEGTRNATIGAEGYVQTQEVATSSTQRSTEATLEQIKALAGLDHARNQQSAKLAIIAEFEAKQAALSEQATNESERKAEEMSAAEMRAEEMRVAMADAAAERMQAEVDAMQRRAQVARETGEATAQALGIAVRAQKGASQAIVGIIADELRNRIIAAVAASKILGATPGGQFFAGALIGATILASQALRSIGGNRGGGGGGSESGGGGGGAISINTINVTSAGGGAVGQDIVSAIKEARRRGEL